MDVVPLKKKQSWRTQFEQLSNGPPENECIRDLGHTVIQMCPPTPTCTRVQKEVIASIKANTISPAEAKWEELRRMIRPAVR